MNKKRNYLDRENTLIDLGHVTKDTKAQFSGSVSDGGMTFPFIFKVANNG